MIMIDWLTVNISPDFVNENIDFSILEQSRAMKNYTHTLRFKASGALLSWGHSNSELYNLIVSGGALSSVNTMAIAPTSPEESKEADIVLTLIEGAKNCSRIDIALTLSDEQSGFMKVSEVLTSITSGELSARYSTEVSFISKLKTDRVEGTGVAVETIYMGELANRAKKGIIRIYDKGKERGKDPDKVTRIEVELKRENANASFFRIMKGKNTLADVFLSRFMKLPEGLEKAVLGLQSSANPLARGALPEDKPEDIAGQSIANFLIQSALPALKNLFEINSVLYQYVIETISKEAPRQEGLDFVTELGFILPSIEYIYTSANPPRYTDDNYHKSESENKNGN